MSEWVPILNGKEFVTCVDCIKCKPREGLKSGIKYGICDEGGNLVYLEPWKEKRIYGGGYVNHHISSCMMYEVGSTHDARRVSNER